MAFYKNVANQLISIYAHDTSADAPKTGDAANITAQISKDGGATATTNDTNPTELDATDAPGVYIFTLTQAESNADLIILSAASSTADVSIEVERIYTTPGDNTAINSNPVEVGDSSTAATNLSSILTASGTSSTSIAANTVAASLTAVDVVTGYSEGKIRVRRGDTWGISLTGLGNISSATAIWFTVKRTDGQTDAEAYVQIKYSSGLLVLNGSDASARSSNGSITINDASAGDITIALAAAETDDLPATSATYDVQMLKNGAITTLAYGELIILKDVTKNIS